MLRVNNKSMMAFLVMVVGLLLVLPSQAEELELPRHKQGYYVSVAPIGALDLHTTADGVRGPWGGPGFRFRMGEVLTDWLDVGIGGGVGWGFSGDYQSVHGNFGIEATLKPTEYLFVTVGAGLGFTDFTRRGNGLDAVVGRFGGEYTLMVGYDFFPRQTDPYQSGGVSISPVLGMMFGPAKPTGTYSAFLGLSVTWWSGLPERKLNLPIEQAY